MCPPGSKRCGSDVSAGPRWATADTRSSRSLVFRPLFSDLTWRASLAARETSFCGCSWVDRRAARERSEYQAHIRAFVEDVHKVALTHNDVGVTRAALLENLTWALDHADQIDPVPDLVLQPAREYGVEQLGPPKTLFSAQSVHGERAADRRGQSPFCSVTLAVFEHPHGRFVHAGDPLK